MSRHNCLAIVLAITVALLSASTSDALICDVEARAPTPNVADGPFDQVRITHMAFLTQWTCTHPKDSSVWLGRRAWRDSQPLHEWLDHVGEDAVVGASHTVVGLYYGCDETWMGMTRAGLYRIPLSGPHGSVWLDLSPPDTAAVSCPPPPGGCFATPDTVKEVTDTNTWIIGRETPRPSRLQLDYDLRFLDTRPEAVVFREEWALLALVDGIPVVTYASTEPFRMYVQKVARDAGVLDGEAPAVLLVEAAEHPRNERYAPIPDLAQFTAQMESWSGEARDVWFRAEVDPTGDVDRVVVLGFAPSFPHRSFRTAMKENLRLEYPDARRHRNVVLGKARVSGEGDLEIENAMVVTMPCRCAPGGDCCWCLGEPVCPCPSACS